jgi:tetratricopeptide (TPR) repeat protein
MLARSSWLLLLLLGVLPMAHTAEAPAQTRPGQNATTKHRYGPAADGAEAPAQTPYPDLFLALPIDSGITVRWACPPVEEERVKKARGHDGFCLGVDASGASWLGYRGRLNTPFLVCPEKALVCETSCSYANFVFLGNGAMLLATDSDWGYLVPPGKATAPGKRPPVVAYQPVAALPVPGARLFAGKDGLVCFAGQDPATGKHGVYTLLTGSMEEKLPGPRAYMRVFSADEEIGAVASGGGDVFIAIGDVIFTVSDRGGKFIIVSQRRVGGVVRDLAYVDGLICYATDDRVGAYTERGTFDLLTASKARIVAHGGTLFVALPDTWGVLALDHAANLAGYDLDVPAVPTNTTPSVKLTNVRCFEAGEDAPPLGERAFSDTFTRTPGRYLYVETELENLQLERDHTEVVKIKATHESGDFYYQSTVTFNFRRDLDLQRDWDLVRFGTADYPPYPGQYTITTCLNGAEADTRTVTITGTASVAEAATRFDIVRLRAALERGESANVRVDGTPLLVWVAKGWYGSTSEERFRRTAEAVRLLLEHGADVKARDANGDTALHKAMLPSQADHADVITMLLRAGADVNARNDSGETPLHKGAAMGWMGQGRVAPMNALLAQKGIDVNARDQDGRTPLCGAVGDGRGPLPIVESLLAKGANPALARKDGGMPLFDAVGNPDMLAAMLKAGANPNATATCFGLRRSLLGQVLLDACLLAFGTDEMVRLRKSSALLLARGAELLAEEDCRAFQYPAYELLGQTSLERVLARCAERSPSNGITTLLRSTDYTDHPAVQRAAINHLLSESRAQVASATSVVHYQRALEYCVEARERTEKYLRPASTWLPEVFYNCALLEAHLGDYARAQSDLARYLELAPKAKDTRAVQAKLQEYAQQEVLLRAPIAPAKLVGVWWPDGNEPEREKFFRVELAMRDGQLQARVLAQQGWEASLPIGEWAPVKIAGNSIEIDGARFRTSTSNDYGSYATSYQLQRIGGNRLVGTKGSGFSFPAQPRKLQHIGEDRLMGTVRFSGTMLKDGSVVPNAGTKACEWRRK